LEGDLVDVRFTLLPGDPARLGDAVRFLEDDARPEIEAEEGSLGMSLHENAELGAALFETFWVSGDAARKAERTLRALHSCAAKSAVATVSTEHYEVALFARAVRPHPGAGVRLTRLETEPSRVDEVVHAFQGTAMPSLREIEGFCEALLFVDRRTGRWIAETVWRDMNVLAASRSAAAAVRVDTVPLSGSVVRTVEEYRLVSSTVRRADVEALTVSP
jgi:quinol monooxygenase YgiN